MRGSRHPVRTLPRAGSDYSDSVLLKIADDFNAERCEADRGKAILANAVAGIELQRHCAVCMHVYD